jgi:hypothetical protein
MLAGMATWDDVRAAVLRLPDTTEQSEKGLSWRVRDKPLAWERPLREADREALGDRAPSGPILGIRTKDLAAKEALLAADPDGDVFFTTPHFDGYPAVLARLEPLQVPVLERLLVEAFLRQAPKRLARAWLEENGVPE